LRREVPFIRRTGIRDTCRLDLPGVLLLDNDWRLAGLFSIADVVFMGGTLCQTRRTQYSRAGILFEAVMLANMQNFAAIAAEFREHQAMVEIANPSETGASGSSRID